MTGPAFPQLLDLLRDAHIVVGVDGAIHFANAHARRILAAGDDAGPLPALTGLVADPPERVLAYLRACAATGSMLPGALRLRRERGGSRVRCHGASLRAADDSLDGLVLLEMRLLGAATDQFLLLNQKVDELTRETRARRHIESALRASEQRFAFLSDASRLLGSSLDFETTLANIARIAVPTFADWAAVDLLGDDGSIRRVAVEHADPARVALVQRISDHYPSDPDAPVGVHNVVRTGRSDVLTEVDDALLVAAAVDDEHLRLLRALQLRSIVVSPLRSQAGVLGAISFAFAESGRHHSDEDVAVIEDLASRAAVAIENSRLLRNMAEARDRIEQQAAELEHQTDELQHQAAVLEEQAVELETQRETAEHAEQYMRGILDGISDAFVVYDREMRFRYINAAAAARMSSLGQHGSDTLIGHALTDAFPHVKGSRYHVQMEHARDERISTTFEEYNARTGTWFEVRCYPLPDEGLAVVWKDVSSRKRAEFEERLLAAAGETVGRSLDTTITLENVARAVVPSFADWCAIDLVTGDGRIERAVTWHADPERAAWGRSVQDRVAPTIDDEWGIGRVIRTGQPEFAPDVNDDMLAAVAPSREHLDIWRQIGFRSAITVPLSVHGRSTGALTLLFAESGRTYTIDDLQLAGEIASRAALAVENARLFQEAGEANRAKSQFLAVMSHELRTPLNAIIGYEDLLQAGIAGPVNDGQREQLARIRAAADQLLGLINQILSLSRIEAGKEEVHDQDLDLATLVRDSVELLAPNAAKKGLELRLHDDAAPVHLRTDVGKLRQILLNLLSNAIKFTDDGRIDVRILRPDAATAIVEVADTGVGIAAADRERVFEPFVQVDPSQTRRHGGTGLGLPVSRELARLLDGDITISTNSQNGSTFVLKLPVQ